MKTKTQYLKDIKPYGKDCSVCGGVNQPFMLSNSLWLKLFPESKGKDTRYIRRNDGSLESIGGFFTCLKCCEDRLGRNLVETDFNENLPPINYGIFGFDCREFVKLKNW